MSYPAYEETKTLDFRWVIDSINEKALQQKVIVRDGIGEDAKITVEWRDIQTIQLPQ